MTLLFLVLWIVVAFFVLRFVGRHYFHESQRADVAAFAVAIAFAAGVMWPYSARIGGNVPALGTAAATPAPEVVTAPKQPGGKDTSAACRSVKGPFLSDQYGSIDDLRSDGQHDPSIIIPEGGDMTRAAGYYLEGWAADPNMGKPLLGACLVVDGKVFVHDKMYYDLSRPDVSASYHNDQLTLSGYRAEIPPGALSPGKHRIQVLALTAGGSRGFIVTAERNVTVH